MHASRLKVCRFLMWFIFKVLDVPAVTKPDTMIGTSSMNEGLL